MGQPHEQQDICKEKFKNIEDYIRTGLTFRETVVRHDQRVQFLEAASMELKESIQNIDKKIDDRLSSVNKSILDLSKNLDEMTTVIESNFAPDGHLAKERAQLLNTLGKLEERVKSLEIWQWRIAGGLVVILFIIDKIWK